MTIQEVMLRIEIPEEVRENIGKYSLSEKEFYEWKHLFENDFEIFLNKWRETQKHFQWVLWFYLKLTCEVHEMYKETGRSGMGCKVYSNGVVPSGKTSV